MARSRYVCQSCGAGYTKWSGRCDSCGVWNSLSEETPQSSAPIGKKVTKSVGKPGHVTFADLSDSADQTPLARRQSDITELDRVCGGGLAAGSAILVGGDPGIGKSTLLLQLVAALADDAACVYVTGEESIEQIRQRAQRLGTKNLKARLAATGDVRGLITALSAGTPPDMVVIDSIQTMYLDVLDAAPGTVSQVRASAAEIIRFAKTSQAVVFLVGHVTKDGQIAGPRVLEHMVDTVLYFEGDRGHQFRILRAVKNRYGATNEIGVFEMSDHGLAEVKNPSALFLAERPEGVSGTAVFSGIEGSRPLLTEIQALVAPTSFGSPRRTVVGWDGGRMAMVLAVLEARCGLALGSYDVYLNVAGGLRLSEPAADLAAAAAIVSAQTGLPLPDHAVFFGEIGLSGEIRAVSQTPDRLREAAKLGFTTALAPRPRQHHGKNARLNLHNISHVRQLIALFEGEETV